MARLLSSTTFTALVSAFLLIVELTLGGAFTPTARADQSQPNAQVVTAPYQTQHRTIEVDGLKIFYREAGPVNASTILLLHGFPTSSHASFGTQSASTGRNVLPRMRPWQASSLLLV